MRYISAQQFIYKINWLTKLFVKYSLHTMLLMTSISFSQTATAPSSGDGSSGNPYQIATLENFYWLSQQEVNSDATGLYWSRNYIQTADIDASASSGWNSNTGWNPIGNATTSFSGTYDGDNHIISNLSINRNENLQGLFGSILGATISNLGITNVSITAKTMIGGLVGQNVNSVISECFGTGSVTSSEYYMGGFVGYNDNSTISNCYSFINVTGNQYFGGFIGHSVNNSIVMNCYTIGTVGGGTNTVGRFVGFNGNAFTNCFWNTETSGAYSGVGSGNTGGLTGKTTSELKTAATFLDASWDSNIWAIDAGFNEGYPYLKWQNPGGSPLPVELISFTGELNIDEIGLKWETATEKNNYGFEVQKSETSGQNSEWETIGFVQGNGTTNSPKNYDFTDSELPNSEEVSYRLKQIDNDGTFAYSKIVTVDLTTITDVDDDGIVQEFALNQNYPNPFNPSTTIKFTIPSNVKGETSNTKLVIYDILGRDVATLVNQILQPGNHEIQFDGSNLSSGMYFYRINAGDKFNYVRKMILVK